MQIPWVEKYRPTKIQDVIGNDKAKKLFVAWLNKWMTGRPEKKVALLYGPPGTGKTSLVHAAAIQYNLELLEANASDVRNSSELERRIRRALTELSLFGKRSKIILLDEIDGINPREDAGGLAMIMEFIEITHFPLVLTANDPWDPKLRNLRNKCLLIRFKPLGIRNIISVLAEICKKEGILCEYEVLRAIAGQCKGDLRAAINDLQAIASGKRKITIEDLQAIGYRAKQADMFEIVRTVLGTKNPEYAKSVLSLPSLDYENLMQWLSENIPYQYSPSIQAIADAYNALSLADIFLRRAKRTNEWSLLPFALNLMTFGVASARNKPPFRFVKYQFPQKLLILSRTRKYREIRKNITSIIAKICHVSSRVATVDILSYLIFMYHANKELTEKIIKTLGISPKNFEELANRMSN